MGDIGVPELIIILVIVIVLFGANRLKGIGSALGGSIREFKQSVKDESAGAALPAAAPQPESSPSAAPEPHTP